MWVMFATSIKLTFVRIIPDSMFDSEKSSLFIEFDLHLE